MEGGGHSDNSVVHMRDQSNAEKGLFSEAKHDPCKLRLGVKMGLILRKRVLFDSIKGRLGIIFKLHQICPPKRTFRGKFGGKIMPNSHLGCVFPGEWKSRLGYVLKTSGQACVQD